MSILSKTTCNFKSITVNFTYLYIPPFERRGHIVLHLSVGRSVNQVMSAQHILSPLLECCQIWLNGCPLGLNYPYWILGHVVKCQGQTGVFEQMLSVQYPLTPLLESGQTRYSECSYGVDDPNWFWVHVVKGKLLVFEKSLSAQYRLNPLLEYRQTQYSDCSLRVDATYWFQVTWSKVQIIHLVLIMMSPQYHRSQVMSQGQTINCIPLKCSI